MTLENFAVDQWNALGASAQRSSFYQADPTRFIMPAPAALVLKNYSVGGVVISRAADNWEAAALGRLNFSGDMWAFWTAVP